MIDAKFKYLEVVERPGNIGPVVKRVDVTKITRQERNKIWNKLDEEYSNDQFITRYHPAETKLKTL